MSRRFPGQPALLLLFCFLLPQTLLAQGLRNAVNWLIYRSLADTTAPGNPSFRLYPTLAYAPETSFEIGFSSLYLFQARRDTMNRVSEVNAFTFITLESQYGLWIDNAIYGHRDKWFFLGRTRFQRFPLRYYGIGPQTGSGRSAVIDANYLIFRQRVLHKVVPNLFAGPEIDYQNLFNTRVEHHAEDQVREYPRGSEGSANLGLGGAIVYDNRHNVLNVRKGYFAEAGVLHYADRLCSDYRFTAFNTDIRGYHPFRKNEVLAWQLLGNFYTGDVPFNQMALMGGESMMRGYYLGRYRDRNMIAGQAEYRMLPFPFSKRFGASFFASTAAVAPSIGRFSTEDIRLAGGAGLRYFLFPKKDIFLRFDVAFTREGWGFYLFTGEAF